MHNFLDQLIIFNRIQKKRDKRDIYPERGELSINPYPKPEIPENEYSHKKAPFKRKIVDAQISLF